MGGIGKTVLAQSLCREQRIKNAFPDGIVWQSIGRELTFKMDARLRAARIALGDNAECGRSEVDCYRSTLLGKAALVVVDDVWKIEDIEPWLAESPRSRVLFTTRDTSIAAGVGTEPHWVELLSAAESTEALAQWSGWGNRKLPVEAESIISQCGRLPLALAMVGAMLRGKPVGLWKHTLNILRSADLAKIKAQFPGYPHPNLFMAIKASVDALEPADRERYYALAVLIEEMFAARVIQQTLWGIDGRGMTAEEATETAEKFINLSLAQRDADGQSIRLHDLQLDYVRAQFTDQEALNLIHAAMRLSSQVIAKAPEQFASQMVGRLLTHENKTGVQEFTIGLRGRAPLPWLLPRWPSLEAPGTAWIRDIEGHPDCVNRVAVNWDRKLAISASNDHTLKVWDIESGRELRTLKGHVDSVHSVAVSKDGRCAISASEDTTLKVWDVESGREVRTLRGHKNSVWGVALSADGKSAISASDDHTLKVWDVENGHELRTLNGHTDWVNGVAMSDDGRSAVSASADKTLKVWDVKSGRELHTLVGHSGLVQAVAVSPDGMRAVSASLDHTLKVWDVEKGRELSTLKGHTGWVNGVAVSKNAKYAISASHDHTLKVWDMESGKELRTLKGHKLAVWGVELSGDGMFAVSASDDHTLKVWNVESGLEVRTLGAHTTWVNGVAASEFGNVAVSASPDNIVEIWELQSGRKLCNLVGHNSSVRGVALSGDGRLAVSASDDHTLKVWDMNKGQELLTLKGHTGCVTGVALSGDGRLAVSASDDHTLKVWNVESRQELWTLEGHTRPVLGVAVSKDGRRAVSISSDDTLRVWDVKKGRELRTLEGYGTLAHGVAVSADAKRAIFATIVNNSLKVWDLESGKELHSLEGHSNWIRGVAVSEDGKYAVSASDDQAVKVWDLDTGQAITTFTCEGSALCCAFCNSTTVVAGDAGGRIYLLELLLERNEFRKRNDTVLRTEQAVAEKKKHVFLSYCRDNQAEVAQLREDLIAAGEIVWWDGQLLVGQDWKLEIHKAIKSAYAIVICLSQQFEARIQSGAYPELRDAIDEYRQCAPGSIYLLPVRLSACEIPSLRIDGATMLDSLHYIDLFPEHHRTTRVQELVHAIQAAAQHP